MFPPSKQLPGAPVESVAYSSLADLCAAAPAGDAADGDLCLWAPAVPGAAVQISFCGVGQVTSRAGRRDDRQDCSLGVGLYLSIKTPSLTSETNT